ncbi:Gfo/Idh/MocA family protein [Halegenticoccus soli]|uniref:Gfo/Idh/MocA family protein n=1 Tax=Halegenticoccus soli TaxID=1985678 RepID=UPI000C6E126F|nr:Gfo/Idh/MocA family oxidoreductase [Halegenticoccus soli]
MTLRTGIVGAGIVSENNHLPAVDRNPRTELVGVCDLDADRARDAADEYGTEAYTDPDALLAAGLDWVHVATPVGTHFDLASAAVEAGVPVTVQKPATTTLDELERLAECSAERGVPVSVVHNWLCYPVVRKLRRRIAAGEFGEIRAVEAAFAGEGRPDETYRGDWVFDLPGGDLEEGLPHPLYLALALGGYPRDRSEIEVLARTADDYERDVAYDGTTLQYVGEGSTLCSISFLSASTPSHRISVHGTDGSATVDVPTTILDAHDADEGPYHLLSKRLERGLRTTESAVRGMVGAVEWHGRDTLEERFDRHAERSADGHYYLLNEVAKALERDRRSFESLERSRWVLTLMEEVRAAAE